MLRIRLLVLCSTILLLVGVELANTNNPTSFDNYTTARPFLPASGVGDFCFPLDLTSSGIANLTDGDKVTLQFTYSGGDGSLYQVSDASGVCALLSHPHIPHSARTLRWSPT